METNARTVLRWLIITALMNLIGGAFLARAFASPPMPEAAREFRERLAGAEPVVGCYVQTVIEHGERCREEEKAVSLGRALSIADEREFVSAVTEALDRIEGDSGYNYLAVLLATLSMDRRFEKPLGRLARLERAAAMPFPYATHALERLKTGACRDAGDFHFREICLHRDLQFDRIRLLKGAL